MYLLYIDTTTLVTTQATTTIEGRLNHTVVIPTVPPTTVAPVTTTAGPLTTTAAPLATTTAGQVTTTVVTSTTKVCDMKDVTSDTLLLPISAIEGEQGGNSLSKNDIIAVWKKSATPLDIPANTLTTIDIDLKKLSSESSGEVGEIVVIFDGTVSVTGHKGGQNEPIKETVVTLSRHEFNGEMKVYEKLTVKVEGTTAGQLKIRKLHVCAEFRGENDLLYLKVMEPPRSAAGQIF